MTSRLKASCVACKHEGDRNEFTSNPLMAEDECPSCGSDDVDVFDPRHSTASDYAYDVNLESN